MKLGKTAYVVLNANRARIFVDKSRLDGSFEIERGENYRYFIEEDCKKLFLTQAPQFPIDRVAVLDVIEGGAPRVAKQTKIGPAPSPKFSA